jgi:hypothetical protein
MLVALVFSLALAADPAPPPAAPAVSETAWAASLTDAIMALPDEAARRARINAELAVTTDSTRAAHLGRALSTLLAAREAGGVSDEVLRGRIGLDLLGDVTPTATAGASAGAVAIAMRDMRADEQYRKRAYVLTEDDGGWGVYRVSSGKPVSARTFAHATQDDAVNRRLRTARVASYVGGGVLAGTALVLAYSTAILATDAWLFPDSDFGSVAAVTGIAAAGCAASAAIIPVVTYKRQKDIHNFYDEERARELVDQYDSGLHQQYGAVEPATSVAFVVSPTALGLTGTF